MFRLFCGGGWLAFFFVLVGVGTCTFLHDFAQIPVVSSRNCIYLQTSCISCTTCTSHDHGLNSHPATADAAVKMMAWLWPVAGGRLGKIMTSKTRRE